jgi:hypothetical protein
MSKTGTRGGIWDDRKARRASGAYAMINTTRYICIHRISVLSNCNMHRKTGKPSICEGVVLLVHGSRQRADSFRPEPCQAEHKRRQVIRMRWRPAKVLETSYRSLLFASAVSVPVWPPGCRCLQKGIRWIDGAFPPLDTGCCAFPRSPKASIKIRLAEHHRLAAALPRLPLGEPSDKPGR